MILALGFKWESPQKLLPPSGPPSPTYSPAFFKGGIQPHYQRSSLVMKSFTFGFQQLLSLTSDFVVPQFQSKFRLYLLQNHDEKTE